MKLVLVIACALLTVQVHDAAAARWPKAPPTCIVKVYLAAPNGGDTVPGGATYGRAILWDSEYFKFHGRLDSAAAGEMLAWEHGGGWSLDASVRVPAWDRRGLEQVVRYCCPSR
jgi:hypothetical protein